MSQRTLHAGAGHQLGCLELPDAVPCGCSRTAPKSIQGALDCSPDSTYNQQPTCQRALSSVSGLLSSVSSTQALPSRSVNACCSGVWRWTTSKSDSACRQVQCHLETGSREMLACAEASLCSELVTERLHHSAADKGMHYAAEICLRESVMLPRDTSHTQAAEMLRLARTRTCTNKNQTIVLYVTGLTSASEPSACSTLQPNAICGSR